MAESYDVIIIGAGIMGVSTALQLARRGHRVCVLEKSVIGVGSTGKSSAIIRTHYSNEVTARMALHSLRVFQNFAGEVGGDSGFTQTGFLALTPAKDLDGLKENLAMQQKVGIETELLARDELAHRWPYLELGDLQAAAYEPQSGYADPNLTLNGYVLAARQASAVVRSDVPVTGLRFEGGVVRGVETPDGFYESPVVVNCSGAWGAGLARMGGVELPLKSCRVQVAFFKRPAGHEAAHPVVADFVHAVYWRSETGGLTLVGMIDPEEEKAVVDPDRFKEQVDFEFVAQAGERLVSRYPALEAAESTGGYAALYGITPDWHPIIDESPAGSGFFHCAGFSGHGFKLGPAVGLMCADMIEDKDTPGMERHMFRLSRFAEGDPVRGAYEYSIVG